MKEYITLNLTCKRCGKPYELTISKSEYNRGKYRKFCSRACANSRVRSDELKDRVSKKLKELNKAYPGKLSHLKTYNCVQCGKPFTIKDKRNLSWRNRRYCSQECKDKWLEDNLYSKSGGYREGSGRGKHGWYKGIWCDSTYELMYVIYCLDHNIDIKRTAKTFQYEYGGKIHTYHPDFEVDGVLIEIKGYYNELTAAKIKSVQEDIKVLYKNDLDKQFHYVYTTYNKTRENVYELYDNYKPKYKYRCDYCGKDFEVDRERNTSTKFCCRNCAGKYMKNIITKNKSRN